MGGCLTDRAVTSQPAAWNGPVALELSLRSGHPTHPFIIAYEDDACFSSLPQFWQQGKQMDVWQWASFSRVSCTTILLPWQNAANPHQLDSFCLVVASKINTRDCMLHGNGRIYQYEVDSFRTAVTNTVAGSLLRFLSLLPLPLCCFITSKETTTVSLSHISHFPTSWNLLITAARNAAVWRHDNKAVDKLPLPWLQMHS